MISLNLLPESKLEHLQAISKQRRVSLLCFGAIAAGIALPIILIVIWGGQKALIGIVQGNIDKKVGELHKVENLEDILTVQNQLHALPGLYDQRLYYTTLLDVLPTLLPTDAHFSSMKLNESNQLELIGTAGSAATVNNFVTILNKAELRENGQSRTAFSSVTLTAIEPSDNGAIFSITLAADSALFQNSLGPDLILGDKVLKSGHGSKDSSGQSTDSSGNLLQEEAR